ncbi:Retrovirus-related Pol polyprotein from transposon TNT 1-94 [Quillaja saponaria]|uniref:Retrovirus-related Pol polyprotein from transposon TNT 1-94 n=1 Tax=Quillaja saponaria TaxID=32244 RepID=A0AAD7VFH1_QUISA|nr:Retrovirus-related Pol polyprotein from transposon TNT 1-94 [Quillaja saponaria]
MPFITSVQGWATQPSIAEFENLLSNQESLVKQMAGVNVSRTDDVFFSKWKGKSQQDLNNDDPENKVSLYKPKKCCRCGKLGHIRRNCSVKLEDGNLSTNLGSNQDEPVEWEKCLSNEVIDDATTSMYS